MNKELAEILKIYSTKKHEDFTNRLVNLSKESLISLFTDLLTMYINDKNSSTIREFLTVTISGYEHSEKKIGFNGFKQSSIVGGMPIACEAKPKNASSEDFKSYKNGNRKSKPQILNGSGNFNDYTYARFKKDKKANPHMLVSGFIDGKLIYILEFPFKTKVFLTKLNNQLRKHFPNGDEKGRYLRGATFDYKDYIDDKMLNLIFVLNFEELEVYLPYFDRKFYHKLFLLSKKNDKIK